MHSVCEWNVFKNVTPIDFLAFSGEKAACCCYSQPSKRQRPICPAVFVLGYKKILIIDKWVGAWLAGCCCSICIGKDHRSEKSKLIHVYHYARDDIYFDPYFACVRVCFSPRRQRNVGCIVMDL